MKSRFSVSAKSAFVLLSTTTYSTRFRMTQSLAVPKPQQPRPSRRTERRDYVFGYGSLICPESRSVTNPNLAHKVPLPVLIQDVERVWSARTSSGYTAMGVQFRTGAECTGILIAVGPEELQDLDRREANYNRLPIHLDNIDHVPFLDEEDFYDADHPVFDAKESKNPSDPDVNVWIYIQKDPIPADPSHPIPQSYVDIIMRGCLTISEDFARSFIETTAGWNDEHEDHWVDDRDVPIYKRADSDYSSANADMIDQLLDENTQLDVRVDYDPVVHLEALADALVDDMAHPLAIQHVVRRVKEAAQCARKKQRLDYDAET